MSFNTRDTWHIEEFQGGWKLVIQPRISWRWMIPHTVMEWLTFAFFVFLAYLAFPEGVLNGRTWKLDQVFLSILMLLFILVTYLVAVWWIYLPPTVRQVLNTRKPIEVTFNPSSFESVEGVFQTACLDSLRLEPIPRLGRFRLVFTGTAVKDAEFVGWPGLPDITAREVLAAVAARSGAGIS